MSDPNNTESVIIDVKMVVDEKSVDDAGKKAKKAGERIQKEFDAGRAAYGKGHGQTIAKYEDGKDSRASKEAKKAATEASERLRKASVEKDRARRQDEAAEAKKEREEVAREQRAEAREIAREQRAKQRSAARRLSSGVRAGAAYGAAFKEHATYYSPDAIAARAMARAVPSRAASRGAAVYGAAYRGHQQEYSDDAMLNRAVAFQSTPSQRTASPIADRAAAMRAEGTNFGGIFGGGAGPVVEGQRQRLGLDGFGAAWSAPVPEGGSRWEGIKGRMRRGSYGAAQKLVDSMSWNPISTAVQLTAASVAQRLASGQGALKAYSNTLSDNAGNDTSIRNLRGYNEKYATSANALGADMGGLTKASGAMLRAGGGTARDPGGLWLLEQSKRNRMSSVAGAVESLRGMGSKSAAEARKDFTTAVATGVSIGMSDRRDQGVAAALRYTSDIAASRGGAANPSVALSASKEFTKFYGEARLDAPMKLSSGLQANWQDPNVLMALGAGQRPFGDILEDISGKTKRGRSMYMRSARQIAQRGLPLLAQMMGAGVTGGIGSEYSNFGRMMKGSSAADAGKDSALKSGYAAMDGDLGASYFARRTDKNIGWGIQDSPLMRQVRRGMDTLGGGATQTLTDLIGLFVDPRKREMKRPAVGAAHDHAQAATTYELINDLREKGGALNNKAADLLEANVGKMFEKKVPIGALGTATQILHDVTHPAMSGSLSTQKVDEAIQNMSKFLDKATKQQ